MSSAKGEQEVAKKLKITQVRSYIGRPEKQRKVLRSLGLGRMNRSVLLVDTPEVRGMIGKVNHLVSVEEFEVNQQ
jgi:large subunit ribosomal protein L30